MKNAIFILLGIILFLINCEEKDPDVYLDRLIKRTWVLDSIKYLDKEVERYPDQNGHIEMEFLETGLIEILGECNAGGASFKINKNKMTISDVSLTEGGGCRIYVPVVWERKLYELWDISSFKVSDSTLYLISDSNLNFYFSIE